MKQYIVGLPIERAFLRNGLKKQSFDYKYQIQDELDDLPINRNYLLMEVDEFCDAINKNEADTEIYFFFRVFTFK